MYKGGSTDEGRLFQSLPMKEYRCWLVNSCIRESNSMRISKSKKTSAAELGEEGRHAVVKFRGAVAINTSINNG